VQRREVAMEHSTRPFFTVSFFSASLIHLFSFPNSAA
jgi:hypothetical protein